MLTYVIVRSGVAIRAKLQESRLKERLSFCLRAVASYTSQSALAALRYFAGTPYSHRENAEMFALFLVPTDLSRDPLIFIPRDLPPNIPWFYKSAPSVAGGAVTLGVILY